MPAYVEGLPVLEEGSQAPAPLGARQRPRTITLRDGAVGFVLAFWADWFDENVERLDQPGEHPTASTTAATPTGRSPAARRPRSTPPAAPRT
jgi:hypothetical protein